MTLEYRIDGLFEEWGMRLGLSEFETKEGFSDRYRAFYGLQAGLSLNDFGSVYGLQASVRNGANSITGLQVGWLNGADTVEYGIQLNSPGLNYCDHLKYGAQIGFINETKESAYGVQTGVINSTDELYGLQTGLVNITKECYGLQTGLFCSAKKGKFLQLGLLTIRDTEEKLPWYKLWKKYTPLIGFSWTKEN